ncbi:uncharacterized protein LOC131953195 [Physella acuta]|uniref:uncharacterized protein LOC131953195 n=1 Tax=Physella acuta TaxID=109671 RepID=UPI0027DCDAB7|nr:uncharacterized protein LOC131953195 [Physella acuta]
MCQLNGYTIVWMVTLLYTSQLQRVLGKEQPAVSHHLKGKVEMTDIHIQREAKRSEHRTKDPPTPAMVEVYGNPKLHHKVKLRVTTASHLYSLDLKKVQSVLHSNVKVITVGATPDGRPDFVVGDMEPDIVEQSKMFFHNPDTGTVVSLRIQGDGHYHVEGHLDHVRIIAPPHSRARHPRTTDSRSHFVYKSVDNLDIDTGHFDDVSSGTYRIISSPSNKQTDSSHGANGGDDEKFLMKSKREEIQRILKTNRHIDKQAAMRWARARGYEMDDDDDDDEGDDYMEVPKSFDDQKLWSPRNGQKEKLANGLPYPDEKNKGNDMNSLPYPIDKHNGKGDTETTNRPLPEERNKGHNATNGISYLDNNERNGQNSTNYLPNKDDRGKTHSTTNDPHSNGLPYHKEIEKNNYNSQNGLPYQKENEKSNHNSANGLPYQDEKEIKENHANAAAYKNDKRKSQEEHQVPDERQPQQTRAKVRRRKRQSATEWLTSDIPAFFDPRQDSPTVKTAGPYVVEVMSMIDAKAYEEFNYDWKALQIYLLHFWQSVNARFQAMIEPKISIRVKSIAKVMFSGFQPFIENNRIEAGTELVDVTGVLTEFRNFIRENYESNPALPDHDVAILLTGEDLCKKKLDGTWSLGSKGIAFVRGGCISSRRFANQSYDVGVAEVGRSFRGVLTTAHEVGHLIGAFHDGEKNSSLCPPSSGFIMSSDWTDPLLYNRFSNCSRQNFRHFLENTWYSQCLVNSDSNYTTGYDLPNQLPGQVFTLTEQCLQYIDGVPCSTVALESQCGQLCCEKWSQPFPSKEPAADGTFCGPGKVCYNGACLQQELVSFQI